MTGRASPPGARHERERVASRYSVVLSRSPRHHWRVSEDETLARVRADLELGRTSMARQRLRGLVGSNPQRLDLREKLAELYRLDGFASQAGRWSYLNEDVDLAEVRAFEREFPDPVLRMRALGWRGPEDAAGHVARERLAAVRAEAEDVVGHALTWERVPLEPRAPTRWGDRLLGALFVAVLVLLVIGVVTFVAQGVQVVIDWFRR